MATINVGSGYSYPATEAGVNNAIAAAAAGDTVYVHGTVTVRHYIDVTKSIILRGEAWDKTIFSLENTAGVFDMGDTWDDKIYNINVENYKRLNGVIRVTANNVEFAYFQVWGRTAFKADTPIKDTGGHGEQRNAILVNEVSGFKMHNVYIKRYVYNDAIRLRSVTSAQIYDCILEGNHDTIALYKSNNITIKNCKLFHASNTCIRISGTGNVKNSYLTLDDNLGGQGCFEMQSQGSGNSIDRCLVKNVDKPFFCQDGQGSCVVSNTVICTGCNASGVTGTNITTNADPNGNWSAYGYNEASITDPSTDPPTDPPTEALSVEMRFAAVMINGERKN